MSPIIVDGLAVAHLGADTNGAIVAYDLNTGVQKWQWTNDGPGYDSPVILTLGDAKLVVTQTDRKIVALNAPDGKLVWQTDFAPKGMAHNTATIIVDGQTLIYTGSGRGTAAVKLEKTGGAVTAALLWKNTDVGPQFASPVLKDGLLYGLSQRGQFYCLNAQTGKTAWIRNRRWPWRRLRFHCGCGLGLDGADAERATHHFPAVRQGLHADCRDQSRRQTHLWLPRRRRQADFC